MHAMAKAKEVLQFYRDYARSCPDEATAFAGLMTSPDGTPIVAIVVGYIGDLADGEAQLAPVQEFGSPLLDTIAPISYVQLNMMFDAAFPYGGVQRYWKSSFLKELGDDALEILVDRAGTMRSPMSMVGFFHVHGAATRVDPNETAFGLRDDQWDYDVISQWSDLRSLQVISNGPASSGRRSNPSPAGRCMSIIWMQRRVPGSKLPSTRVTSGSSP